MKKAICILLCCLTVLWMPSCTPEQNNADNSVSTTTSSEQLSTVDVRSYLDKHTTTSTIVTTTADPTTDITTTTTADITTITTTTTTVTTKAPTTTTEHKRISRTVYVTPSGKRYHYRSTCGGKNSYAVTLDEAVAMGRTPCQKCAA